jgi:hypothetical protein
MKAPVVEPLDIQALPTITDHPLVRNLWVQHRALRDRQGSLTAELATCRQTIVHAEREGGDLLAPSRPAREARRRAEAIADQLDALEDEMTRCTEAMEGAKAQATEELRPLLHRQAIEAFMVELEAAESLLIAQAARLELVKHARRLGVSLHFSGGMDQSLAWQISALRKAIERLQD